MIDYLENVFSIDSSVKAIKLNRLFNGEPIFFVSDTGVHNRTIDTWDHKGLIVTPRKNKGIHRRFNFLEFVWIKLLEELDALGIKGKALKRTKRELFYHVNFRIMMRLIQTDTALINSWPDGSGKEELLEIIKKGVKRKRASKQFNLFQLLLTEAITSRMSVSLLIFKDGGWLPVFGNRLDLYPLGIREKIFYETHVVVSLTRIIRKFFAHPKAILILKELNLFTSVELKVLRMISAGDYESIQINPIDEINEPVMLEKSNFSDVKLVDYLVEGKYKKILLNAEGGMVVIVENIKR